ncbi:MAG: S8 family serine peptidase [Planctomycetes bacterium]|nr:S8 family serine peptidase [Planctomycetota bacterium]
MRRSSHQWLGLLPLALASIASAQESMRDPLAPLAEKLHPYLREQLGRASDTQLLPAYFVIGAKLSYEHFFPRVRRLPLAERRATVVRELEEHMLRTQAELMAVLASESAAGRAKIVSRNFLGNFVRVEATRQAIAAAAALPSVREAWFDYAPPAEAVEDGSRATSSAPLPAPGNGPLDTRANLVWAQGIDGTGVVWMNSDSGCNIAHPALVNGIWRNPGEIAGNSRDDDGNGYADDLVGWDFGANNPDVNDSGGHGTSCAGVFVAIDHTNQDTLGNCPGAKLMTGQLSGEASQWDAIQYAIRNGADGQTSSHSYKLYFNPPPNYAMHRDVGETSLAAGLIRTNSTSNDGGSCASTTNAARRPFNISAPGCLPPPWIDPNQTLIGREGGVLGIGAHLVGTQTLASYTPCGPFAWHWNDVRVNSPAYPAGQWDSINDNDYPYAAGTLQGLLKPDLTAPTGTRTSSGTSSYSNFSGTSNATPSASSVLVLAKQANPSITPEDMAMAAHLTARPTGAVSGKENTYGAGQIDAWELVRLARNLHRVNGEVAHTVSLALSSTPSLDLEIDGLPAAPFFLLIGTGLQTQTISGITLRLANPSVLLGSVLDAQGSFHLIVPTIPALAGLSFATQSVIFDPAFGPFTGSNAVLTHLLP